MLIDTHTHIYAAALDEDREEAIKRAIAAGVLKLILPALTQKQLRSCMRSNAIIDHVYLMMGPPNSCGSQLRGGVGTR